MMKSFINCALLIDDDRATNFFNKSIVTRHAEFQEVIAKESGNAALNYLKEVENGNGTKPNIIFLDLNMPGMDGWGFVKEFEKLNKDFIADIKLVILTTSSNPDDYVKSQNITTIDDYVNKPLSVNILDELIENHYYNISGKI